MNRNPYVRKYFDIILGLLIPPLAVFFLLRPVLLPSGYLFYGDELLFTELSPGKFLAQFLFAWSDYRGPTFNAISILPALMLSIGFKLSANVELTYKMFYFVLAALPGVVMFFSARMIISDWFPAIRSDKMRAIVPLVACLVYTLAFTNVGLSGPLPTLSLLYAFLPLTFSTYAKALARCSAVFAWATGAFSIGMASFPQWGILFAVLAAPLTVGQAASSKGLMGKWRVIRVAIISSIALFAFNSFWLIPAVASYTLGAGGPFSTYTSAKLISPATLQFSSRYTILDALLIGHSAFSFFFSFDRNWTLASLAVPVLAFVSICLLKSRYIASLSLSAVVSIFLAKGVNPPVGGLYYLAASSLPYGLGAILRNVTTFELSVVLCFSLLIGFAIHTLVRSVLSSVFRKHTALQILLAVGLLLLAVAPLTWGTWKDMNAATYSAFSPSRFPDAYNLANEFLASMHGDFAVMWIPEGGAYLWKNNYPITSWPTTISHQPSVDSGLIWPYPLNSTREVGRILAGLGVKYLVFHSDATGFPNDKAMAMIESQVDLSKVANFTIPGEVEYALTMTVDYRLPSAVTSSGFQGRFWAGFGVHLNAYPQGSFARLAIPIAESSATNQTLLDDYHGSVVFRFSASANRLAEGLDLYLNYYDGAFKPLSELYKIGTLGISGKAVTVAKNADVSPLFNTTSVNSSIHQTDFLLAIFENHDYRGPLFLAPTSAENASLDSMSELGNSSSPNSTHITDYQQISPTEWSVTVNASSPFVLVMAQPFDPLWRAETNKFSVASFRVLGFASGFVIESTGIISIKLYYLLQSYQQLGWDVLLLAFVVPVVYAMIKRKMKPL